MNNPGLTKTSTDAIRQFLALITARYPVTGAYLFGSRARGANRPDSNADLAILLQGPPGQFLDTKLALADIAYDVLLETEIRIQALPTWKANGSNRKPILIPNCCGIFAVKGCGCESGRSDF